MRRWLLALLFICTAPGLVWAQSPPQTETLTVSSTALPISAGILTNPQNLQATACLVSVETDAIRVRYDGTDPTAGVGHPFAAGETFPVLGAARLRLLRMIRQTTDASVTVTCSYGEATAGIGASGGGGSTASTVAVDSFLDSGGDDMTDDGNDSLNVTIVSGGGTGGTSSDNGAAFPTPGTAAGFNDGTNMQGAVVFDLDTGAGTEYVLGASMRIGASGASIPITAGAGAVAAGTPRVTLASDDPLVAAVFVDDDDVTDDTSSGLLGVCWYESSPSTATDGDAAIIHCDNDGAVHVADGGNSLTVDASDLDVQSGGVDLAQESGGNLDTITSTLGGLSITEDGAVSGGEEGIMILCARRDTSSDSSSGMDDDFSMCSVDSNGRLYVNATLYNSSGTEITVSDVVEDAGETADGSGPMVLSVRRDTPASSAGTSGDNATFNTDSLGALYARTVDPCSSTTAKQYIPIDITSATTTELTASLAGASTYWYVCALNLVTTAANAVALVDDDTDNCASVTAGLAGGLTAAEGWSFAANGGISMGNGAATIMKSVTANSVLCLVTSAATQLSGQIVAVPAL